MTTREEDVYKLAFTQATEVANERPLPSWQPLETDDDHSEAQPVPLVHEHTARGSAVAATVAPGAQRGHRTQWLVAASIALVLVLSVAGLVTRFAPTAQVADTPSSTPSQTQASATPSTPAPTTPDLDNTPCFRVPGYEGAGQNPSGKLPSTLDRIWLCGQGYDDKPLQGQDAANLLTRLKALPAPSGKDDGLGGCYRPEGDAIQFFLAGDDELHGYHIQPSACGAFAGVSSIELVKEIQRTVKEVNGAPSPTSTSDDPCEVTNLRHGYVEKWDVTKANICTDINGTVLKPSRPIKGDLFDAIHTQWNAEVCAEAPQPAGVAMAFRVSDGKNVSVWYLIGTLVVIDGRCGWVPDAVTLQGLRDLAAPEGVTPKPLPTAQSSAVPPLSSPCNRYPNVDNLRGLLNTVDRIWLCGEGWDLRPLVGDEATAVLKRIQSRPTGAPGGAGCAAYGNFAQIYMDSGSERRGYFLAPPCTEIGGVNSEVIYDEVRSALLMVNGPASKAVPNKDLCLGSDVPMGDPYELWTPTASVCSDASGKPLTQGRPIDADTLKKLLRIQTQAATEAPDLSSFIVIRASSAGLCPGASCGQQNYLTMYLIGNQLWTPEFAAPRVAEVDPATVAKIRQLAGG